MAVGARLGFTIAMMKEMARAEAAGAFVIDKRKQIHVFEASTNPQRVSLPKQVYTDAPGAFTGIPFSKEKPIAILVFAMSMYEDEELPSRRALLSTGNADISGTR
ncbi:hypothetical protein SNOG_02242 [Parastagonospora nodorum SN15]|uniref:Uncharacterized protein n=1 Tax=Phaeosphaeria nodorum (strain SN15 / ATCC MYA-4574 / FGSC 10173) TaxID=321614 RepID=Q0V172_PHANO|nr:hypothetical protein SNOG_02242 [Parastagonospora nodorum SN15]EAT90454.1 hypothetical protein SNOG_02242 [Parastagonospora nodorum SN15]